MNRSETIILTDDEDAVLGLAAHILRTGGATKIPAVVMEAWARKIDDVRARYAMAADRRPAELFRGSADGHFPPGTYQPPEAA